MYLSTTRKQKMSPVDKLPKKVFKSDVKLAKKVLEDSDDDSAATFETPPKSVIKEAPMTSKLLRLTYRVPIENDTPSLPHIQFLKHLKTTESTVTAIFNKRHENLKIGAIESLSNEQIYQNHFDMHSVIIGKNKNEKLITVIQEIQTTSTIPQIKRNPEVFKYLREQKIQIHEHEWKTEDWNIKTVGFLPKFSPLHHPKELASKALNMTLRQVSTMPSFRLRKVTLNATVFQTTLKVQVYAIEVQAQHASRANRVLMEHIKHPEEYVSFRMQYINKQAFEKAIAYTAQFHDDLRTIVIKQVSEDAFFILENQTGPLDPLLGVYHLPSNNSMRIIVAVDDFITIRNEIKNNLKEWNKLLDPSDIRLTGEPVLSHITADDYSDDNMTQLSYGIESLMSLDITEFTIFQDKFNDKRNTSDRPISEVTTQSVEDIVKLQQEQIHQQNKQIEELMTTIKEMKDETNTKIDKMLQMIVHLTTSSKASIKETGNAESTTRAQSSSTNSNTTSKRRL